VKLSRSRTLRITTTEIQLYVTVQYNSTDNTYNSTDNTYQQTHKY